jgi:hypothetical protein
LRPPSWPAMAWCGVQPAVRQGGGQRLRLGNGDTCGAGYVKMTALSRQPCTICACAGSIDMIVCVLMCATLGTTYRTPCSQCSVSGHPDLGLEHQPALHPALPTHHCHPAWTVIFEGVSGLRMAQGRQVGMLAQSPEYACTGPRVCLRRAMSMLAHHRTCVPRSSTRTAASASASPTCSAPFAS